MEEVSLLFIFRYIYKDIVKIIQENQILFMKILIRVDYAHYTLDFVQILPAILSCHSVSCHSFPYL